MHQMANTNPQNNHNTLLDICLKHLTNKDFATAQNFALLAHKIHPNRPEFPQISAIAAVHLAAGRRLPDNQLDHLSILQLDSKNSDYGIHTIRTKFKDLLLLLHPSKNNYPFASEGLQLVLNAWSVLSDPDKRAQMENAGENHPCGVKETFWTVCPYCYCLFEYESLYKDCCFMCQNCSRAFQGVPVAAPDKSMIVEGKEEYYCRVGWFPLQYYYSCLDEKKKKRESCGFSGVTGGVKDEELKSVGVEQKEESNVKVDEIEKMMQGSGGSVKVGSNGYGRRVKSKACRRKVKLTACSSNSSKKKTACNSKKIMGRGKRVKMDMNAEFVDFCGETEDKNESIDLNFSLDDVEIIVGEDDMFFDLEEQDLQGSDGKEFSNGK